jgi:hypothetical protein
MENDFNLLPGNKKSKNTTKKNKDDSQEIEWSDPLYPVEKLELDKVKNESLFDKLGLSAFFGSKEKKAPAGEAKDKPHALPEREPEQIKTKPVIFEKVEKKAVFPGSRVEKKSNWFGFLSAGKAKSPKSVSPPVKKPQEKDFAMKEKFESPPIIPAPKNEPKSRLEFVPPPAPSPPKHLYKEDRAEDLLAIPPDIEKKEVDYSLFKSKLVPVEDMARKKLKTRKDGGSEAKEIGNLWEKSDVVATNLIKEQSLAKFDIGKLVASLAFSIVVPCLILAAAYGIMAFRLKQNMKMIETKKQDFEMLEQNIRRLTKTVKEQKILEKGARLAAIRFLLDTHIYWTNFFQFLEDNTFENVYFSGFSGDTEGKYVLDGTARSLREIDEQIKQLKTLAPDVIKTGADGVGIGSVYKKDMPEEGTKAEDELGSPGYVFKLKLDLDPRLFNYFPGEKRASDPEKNPETGIESEIPAN